MWTDGRHAILCTHGLAPCDSTMRSDRLFPYGWRRLVWTVALVTGCGGHPGPTPITDDTTSVDHESSVSPLALPQLMDRVREASGLFVAAHRGGPAPGHPENALETLRYGFERGVRMFEVDVAESQDGVLYLMHDRSLRRTGGFDGGVADTDWSVVETLDLRDCEGVPTGFSPPKLEDALGWAKRSGAILELDRKETTSFRNIIELVRAEAAEDHVVIISYDDDEAIRIASLAPRLMMTASVRDAEHANALAAAGVDLTRVIAWLGTREPDADAMAELGRRGIETAFGTLGRPGRRLDDLYTADGDASEYRALVDAGLTLLATDRPYFVVRNLTADDVVTEMIAHSRSPMTEER